MRAMLTTVAVACSICSPALAMVVFTNDFEADTQGFSSAARSSLPSDDLGYAGPNPTMMLGRFANDDITLTLSGLAAGVPHDVAFDLFIGASWDGNSTAFGPDSVRVTAGIETLIDATFINLVEGDAGLTTYTQSYSDATPVGAAAFAPFAGADVRFDNTDEPSIFGRYAIYFFGRGVGNPVLGFTPLADSIEIRFQGLGLQDVSDEFWAIDNVVVTVVPEPASLALIAAAMAVVARRRA
jgi:hypothetical protein